MQQNARNQIGHQEELDLRDSYAVEHHLEATPGSAAAKAGHVCASLVHQAHAPLTHAC